jgi:hypothetical protein
MNLDLAIHLEGSPNSEYESFFRLLLSKFSKYVKHPVKVRLKQIDTNDDDSAYCVFDGSYFNIVIDPRLCFGARCQLLKHELAHCIAPWNTKEDHSSAWGAAYAKLYREYLELYDAFWHTEKWLAIPGFESSYEVSNFGHVKSLERLVKARGGKSRTLKEHILSPCVSSTGNGSAYLSCALSYKGKATPKKVHSLVALAFFGVKPDKHVVCHGRAGNLCNHVANLSYQTESTNQKHRRRDGTAGKKVRNSLGHEYVNCAVASEETGIPKGSISRVCRGELKTTRGLGWEYIS